MQLNDIQGTPLNPLDVAPIHNARYRKGEINNSAFERIMDWGFPGIGACPVMGTANTMAALTEAMGMSLPGNSTVPGLDSRLLRLAFRAGESVLNLLHEEILPTDILTADAFANAIRVLMAIGGSTNAVLHLQSIAAELDIAIPPETFNRLSETTPFICDISPSGSPTRFIRDFDEAGGIQALMKEIQPLLATGIMTITGKTVGENLKNAPPTDHCVIRTRALVAEPGPVDLMELVSAIRQDRGSDVQTPPHPMATVLAPQSCQIHRCRTD